MHMLIYAEKDIFKGITKKIPSLVGVIHMLISE